MKRPRLNQLRSFEAAARNLSFSRAAAELGISQAAVSQQMRQLEDYLDTVLFDRQYRQVALTSVGQAYFEVVHEAIDRLDTVTEQLFPGRDRKSVSLLCTSSLAALWLMPQLKSLQRLHPGIDLRINTLDRNRGPGGQLNSDLEIVTGLDGATDTGNSKLLTATITPVCSPRLLERNGDPDTPADLLGFDLIHILGYEDDWHRWFRRNGVKRARVPDGLSVDSSLIAIEAVQRGEAVMLGRRPFIDYLLESSELVEICPGCNQLLADYYLRRRGGGLPRPEVEVVANWVRALAL